tara:strand:+ start:12941 stop:13537 length:597 start_codon:yes stop_codon:yes gene_type:complete
MMVIGLTGGIGSGKTTVAKMFADLNVPVYYSDLEAKYLMVTSEPLQKQIRTLLGEEAYLNKELNRKFIADKVFASPELLSALNNMVHPAVKQHFMAWVKRQNTAYVIQESALIFENSSQKKYDHIILVTAPEVIRIQRVIDRDHLPIEKVKERIANQLSEDVKAKNSDFVIINLNLEETKKKVSEIHKQLLNLSGLSD